MKGRRRGRFWPLVGAAGVLVLAAAGVGAWRLSTGPGDALSRGLAAYRRGDWAGASALAAERLRKDPADRDALRLRARSAARLGRDEAAQGLFRRLGVRDAKAEDFLLLAATLLREGNLAQALPMLERANAADPDHPEVLFELSGLYAGMDRLAEAIALAERLARIPGWEARAGARRGPLHDDQNEPARAAEALESALRADPLLRGAGVSPTSARIRLARVLLKVRRPADARSQLETVLADGTDREAEWLLSRAAIQQGDRTRASAALAVAGGFGGERPEAFEPAPFVGSARCAECHAEIHRYEQAGRHAHTFHPADDLPAIRLTERPLADADDPKASYAVGRQGDRLALRASVAGKDLAAVVDFVLGSGKHALTPVGRDGEGHLRELRLTYYAEIGGWDRTPGHPAVPRDESGYLGEPQSPDSLRRCLNCHTTNFRAAMDRSGPEAADRGIGCERCHGPGGNHVAALELEFPDPAIGRFKGVPESRVMALCAQCHGTRGRAVPDDDPILTVRFQATALIRTKCYIESREALGCLTCHSPHRDAGDRPASFYESRCLACHAREARPTPGPGRSARAPVLPERARRVVCPVNPAGDCLSCHMPPVKGPVPHATFTDHDIRVRRR